MTETTIPVLKLINELSNQELAILFREYLALSNPELHQPKTSLYVLSRKVSTEYNINPVQAMSIVNQHLMKIAANSFIQQNK